MSLSIKSGAKCANYDVSCPLDYETALKNTGNNKKFYFKLLAQFVNKTFYRSIKEISKALEDKNWKKFKSAAHNLKAANGYIGAGNIHYDCYYIQGFGQSKNYAGMVSRYNRFIEDSILFLIYVKKFVTSNAEKDWEAHEIKEFEIN